MSLLTHPRTSARTSPGTDPTRRPHPARIARRLARSTELWSGVVEFDATERWFTRIAREEGWEAWLLSWLPGQGTDWHDHGGSAGAFTVLRGRLVERTARPNSDGTATLDDTVRTVAAGGLRPFGPEHLHQVDHDGTEPAVSLHVYAPGLDLIHDYVVSPDDPRRLLPAATRRAGVSW